MNEGDIQLYLRAKDRWSYGNLVVHIANFLGLLAISSLFIPVLNEFTIHLFLAAIFIGTSTYGVGSRSYVTRKQLLEILERQVNSDPDSLAFIAAKSREESTEQA